MYILNRIKTKPYHKKKKKKKKKKKTKQTPHPKPQTSNPKLAPNPKLAL